MIIQQIFVVAAWRTAGELSSDDIWSNVLELAELFDVTGSLMRQRLCGLGWLSFHPDRTLSVARQGALALVD